MGQFDRTALHLIACTVARGKCLAVYFAPSAYFTSVGYAFLPFTCRTTLQPPQIQFPSFRSRNTVLETG